jgi:hypothetical protein
MTSVKLPDGEIGLGDLFYRVRYNVEQGFYVEEYAVHEAINEDRTFPLMAKCTERKSMGYYLDWFCERYDVYKDKRKAKMVAKLKK